MGCGSTIGPILASGVGIRTVDCGIPQLSMHRQIDISPLYGNNRLWNLVLFFWLILVDCIKFRVEYMDNRIVFLNLYLIYQLFWRNPLQNLWLELAWGKRKERCILDSSRSKNIIVLAWIWIVRSLILQFSSILNCSVREICGKEDINIAYQHFKAFYRTFSMIDKKLNVDS